jgi:hypothetical protein
MNTREEINKKIKLFVKGYFYPENKKLREDVDKYLNDHLDRPPPEKTRFIYEFFYNLRMVRSFYSKNEFKFESTDFYSYKNRDDGFYVDSIINIDQIIDKLLNGKNGYLSFCSIDNPTSKKPLDKPLLEDSNYVDFFDNIFYLKKHHKELTSNEKEKIYQDLLSCITNIINIYTVENYLSIFNPFIKWRNFYYPEDSKMISCVFKYQLLHFFYTEYQNKNMSEKNILLDIARKYFKFKPDVADTTYYIAKKIFNEINGNKKTKEEIEGILKHIRIQSKKKLLVIPQSNPVKSNLPIVNLSTGGIKTAPTNKYVRIINLSGSLRVDKLLESIKKVIPTEKIFLVDDQSMNIQTMDVVYFVLAGGMRLWGFFNEEKLNKFNAITKPNGKYFFIVKEQRVERNSPNAEEELKNIFQDNIFMISRYSDIIQEKQEYTKLALDKLREILGSTGKKKH